ncbi:hypothetical protein CLV71_1101 [Actinophytocola oryzae]|uniref:Membrane-associated oxidoreductase n=2 Tax=Actinophytocola oryzae TaxID=502181 RepID=A0A4R7VCJ5_9PSEU|nr:hypothetical protein CLV71_1101 [Actinophytocola oryzae]
MGRQGELDPHGLRIRGVRVVGQLDLAHVNAVAGLQLHDCVLSEGVVCHHARLREMDLGGSVTSRLSAEGLRTENNLLLRDITVRGEVRLGNAHIGGRLDLGAGRITNDTGLALHADGLRTAGDASFGDAVVRGACEEGTIRLVGADIGGQLGFEGCVVTNEAGPALVAHSLHVKGRASLRKAIMHGTGEMGTVRLISADFDGQLSFEDGVITNDAGPAMVADGLHTGGRVSLRKVTVCGTGETGAVRLTSANIGSQLSFDDGVVTNRSGPALYADRLRTSGRLSLRKVSMHGTDEDGTIRLRGAHIGGQLDLESSEVTNGSGPALGADGLRVDSDAFLHNAVFGGSGKHDTIRLVGAHIGGCADLTLKELRHSSGRLLDLSLTNVGEELVLPARVMCPARSTRVTREPCTDHERQLNARGLVFSGLESAPWREWLHLLVHHTPAYSPQPYQQLAAVERGAGHDNNARQILITQQEDLRRRTPEALGGRGGRARHRLWGWLGRYGYRAHRLVAALAFVLAVVGGLGYVAGQVPTRPGHHAAEHVQPASATNSDTRCSTAELIGLAFDRGLPLGTTGVRARCDLDTGTRWGQTFTYAIWALQALVWALATLAVAAYTGLVRKPS